MNLLEKSEILERLNDLARSVFQLEGKIDALTEQVKRLHYTQTASLPVGETPQKSGTWAVGDVVVEAEDMGEEPEV